jgi:hypothetical protein
MIQASGCGMASFVKQTYSASFNVYLPDNEMDSCNGFSQLY